jgi:hypothetical protein
MPLPAATLHLPPPLLFASDATLTGIGAGALLLVAALAGLGERRRKRRRQIDAVGWVPWTTLSVGAFLPGAILLMLAVKGWLAG